MSAGSWDEVENKLREGFAQMVRDSMPSGGATSGGRQMPDFSKMSEVLSGLGTKYFE